jgi:hypothetical protein
MRVLGYVVTAFKCLFLKQWAGYALYFFGNIDLIQLVKFLKVGRNDFVFRLSDIIIFLDYPMLATDYEMVM